MHTHPYTFDVDVQVVPGRGYSASYVIGMEDGTIVHRRQIARRFNAYSEAMTCALDAAKAAAASLPRAGKTNAVSVPRQRVQSLPAS